MKISQKLFKNFKFIYTNNRDEKKFFIAKTIIIWL